MSYFNQIDPNFKSNVKTIILKTPEECLKQNSIIDELTKQGHQILPSVLFPNEIHISYLESERFNPNHNSSQKSDNISSKYSYKKLSHFDEMLKTADEPNNNIPYKNDQFEEDLKKWVDEKFKNDKNVFLTNSGKSFMFSN